MNLTEELRRNRSVFLAANQAALPQEEAPVPKISPTARFPASKDAGAAPPPVPSVTGQTGREEKPSVVYSLSAPHEAAAVQSPAAAEEPHSAQVQDPWDSVLRRMETEVRFRPQTLTEEEMEWK